MLKAGTARITLQPRVGADLVGYFMEQTTTGIHDDIHARALVLDDGETCLALCSVEACVIPVPLVQAVRATVSQRCPLQPHQIHIFTTHTHAVPGLHVSGDWLRSPIDTMAEAIIAAYESRQPARVGIGFGQLQGYSINRRWMNRPVDPSIGVIRVDTAEGEPLALLGNYGNHAVVLGYDNRQISGDFPGTSSTLLEAHFGAGFVALFSVGGAGDVNPITDTVRQKLQAGLPMQSIGTVSTLYAGTDRPGKWDITDRAGGTFAEAETIAIAYNAEVLRVWQAIQTSDYVPLWIEIRTVNGARERGEPPLPSHPELLEYLKAVSPDVSESNIPLEIALIGIADCVIQGQPGECFSETSVEFRKLCQQMGYAYPILISCINGWYSYLVPGNAHVEGGYEVAAAQSMGLSRYVQDFIDVAIIPVLQAHIE